MCYRWKAFKRCNSLSITYQQSCLPYYYVSRDVICSLLVGQFMPFIMLFVVLRILHFIKRIFFNVLHFLIKASQCFVYTQMLIGHMIQLINVLLLDIVVFLFLFCGDSLISQSKNIVLFLILQQNCFNCIVYFKFLGVSFFSLQDICIVTILALFNSCAMTTYNFAPLTVTIN